MKCEGSVITMILHWHSSQVSSLGNCVDDTPIETDLRDATQVDAWKTKNLTFHL